MEALEAVGISGKFCLFIEATLVTDEKEESGLYFEADFSRWTSLRI